MNVPRGTFGVYWYDRGPTTPAGLERAIEDYKRTGDFDALGYLTKKELYKRTGDTKFLRRTPSFNDRAFMDALAGITRATARNKARYNMDYYFVGDEGSLTSYGDPVDFDWSPQALADFREWLEGEYKTLDALNRVWRSDFKSWDAVLPSTTEQARKSGNFAPWADHRTFMEATFARAYARVREAVVEGDPEARIALSGTQETNAYNGADWYRLDQVIDDFLSYEGGNQWDMHRSFAKPDSMIGFWTGYGSSGIGVQNAIWNAAVNNVLHPNIFWMYSFLDPDLTHSNSARDMGLAFRSLRFEGVGKLLMESERLGDGIAVHYSMPSVHGASILGYHRNFDGGADKAPEKARRQLPRRPRRLGARRQRPRASARLRRLRADRRRRALRGQVPRPHPPALHGALCPRGEGRRGVRALGGRRHRRRGHGADGRALRVAAEGRAERAVRHLRARVEQARAHARRRRGRGHG